MKPKRRRLRDLAATALLTLCGVPAYAGTCYLACLGPAACMLNDPAFQLNAGKPKPHPHCETLKITEGTVEGLIAIGGKSYNFVVVGDPQGKPLKPHVERYAAAPCAVAETECRASQDAAFQRGRGGKPFDGAAGHAPTGNPCQLGLPCGLVRQPSGALHFTLEDRQLDGQLEVLAIRGATGAARVPVKAGQVEIPAGFLTPGAGYSYSMSKGAGSIVAAGQFAVASPQMETDYAEDLAEARKKLGSADLALLQALLENGFDWDAYQFMKRPGARR